MPKDAPVTVRRVEAQYTHSVLFTLSNGEKLSCLVAGRGSNAENIEARRDLVEALQRTLSLRDLR